MDLAPSDQRFPSPFLTGPVHLADVAVIVLQHVARIFDARQIYRDLQMIGRNGNKITLGLLAAFWWFMFLRALYGFGQFVGRLAKAAVSSVGEDTYRG